MVFWVLHIDFLSGGTRSGVLFKNNIEKKTSHRTIFFPPNERWGIFSGCYCIDGYLQGLGSERSLSVSIYFGIMVGGVIRCWCESNGFWLRCFCMMMSASWVLLFGCLQSHLIHTGVLYGSITGRVHLRLVKIKSIHVTSYHISREIGDGYYWWYIRLEYTYLISVIHIPVPF